MLFPILSRKCSSEAFSDLVWWQWRPIKFSRAHCFFILQRLFSALLNLEKVFMLSCKMQLKASLDATVRTWSGSLQMLIHTGTCSKPTPLPASSLGAQRLQIFETSSLQSTPIIQSFRETLRSYYFTQESEIFSTMNPRRKLALNGFGYHFKFEVWRQPTKLQDLYDKCKINSDFNLRKIVNLMTRNCVHIKTATVTRHTRTQSHSLLTRKQKHFAGTDEKPLQEERLNYLIEQAKSAFMRVFRTLIPHNPPEEKHTCISGSL